MDFLHIHQLQEFQQLFSIIKNAVPGPGHALQVGIFWKLWCLAASFAISPIPASWGIQRIWQVNSLRDIMSISPYTDSIYHKYIILHNEGIVMYKISKSSVHHQHIDLYD